MPKYLMTKQEEMHRHTVTGLIIMQEIQNSSRYNSTSSGYNGRTGLLKIRWLCWHFLLLACNLTGCMR